MVRTRLRSAVGRSLTKPTSRRRSRLFPSLRLADVIVLRPLAEPPWVRTVECCSRVIKSSRGASLVFRARTAGPVSDVDSAWPSDQLRRRGGGPPRALAIALAGPARLVHLSVSIAGLITLAGIGLGPARIRRRVEMGLVATPGRQTAAGPRHFQCAVCSRADPRADAKRGRRHARARAIRRCRRPRRGWSPSPRLR